MLLALGLVLIVIGLIPFLCVLRDYIDKRLRRM
jgi:uncharacterized protein YjeT (DUF2065 family)